MPKETILVIDSDTETAQQMVMTLEDEDYLVFTAPSGGMGVAMAKKVSPSLVFLSPASGGGLDVCREIHEIGPLKDVPIIALTSFEGASDPGYASEYGIVDFLGKSCSVEELISKTRRALSLKMEEARGASGGGGSGQGGRLSGEHEISGERKEVSEWSASAPASGGVDSSPSAPETASGKEEEEVTDLSSDDGSLFDQGPPPRERRRWRTRRKSRAPSLAFIAILIILALVTAAVIVSYDSLVSWMGGRSQGPVSKPVAARKAAVEPGPAVLPAVSPQPKPEVKEEQPSTPKPTPSGQSVIAKVVPKSDSGQTDEPQYSVQMGAFRNGKNAEGLAGQFREKGYDAFVLKGMKNGETVYRVLIGRFEDLRKASAMAVTVNAKEHVKVTVFRGQNQSP